MKSFAEFVHMGGYGFFVWSAYGIWAAVMIWNVLAPWLRHRQVLRQLDVRLRGEEFAAPRGTPVRGHGA